VWTLHSTNSAREVADEFARTAFEQPRKVRKLTADPGGPCYDGEFTLVGGTQVYYLSGRAPGVWTVTAKVMP